MQWHRILPIAAWAFLTFIAFATLSPFSLRPELTETEPFLVVVLEHVGAFGLLGLLFLISYPERPRTVALVILGSAVALSFPKRSFQIATRGSVTRWRRLSVAAQE